MSITRLRTIDEAPKVQLGREAYRFVIQRLVPGQGEKKKKLSADCEPSESYDLSIGVTKIFDIQRSVIHTRKYRDYIRKIPSMTKYDSVAPYLRPVSIFNRSVCLVDPNENFHTVR